MPESQRQIRLRQWTREGIPDKQRASIKKPAAPAKPGVPAPEPGQTREFPWKFRLEDWVYVRGEGNEPFIVLGGSREGPMRLPVLRLRDKNGVEQTKLQLAVSSKPIEP